MKYYSYSVKAVLAQHFGKDALSAMRKPHDDVFETEDRKNLLPLSWQYADERTLHLFLDHKFLTGTSIEDDYIAYLYQQDDQQCVLLMFMLYEEKAPFSIHTRYACKIIKKWEDAGYHAKIISQCIRVEGYGKRFQFGQHTASGAGTYIYKLIKNGRKPMLVFDEHRCWPVYYEKLIHVTASKDIREYECLFEPAVSITSGDKDNKKNITAGIAAAANFWGESAPLRVCFSEFRGTGIYGRVLLAGDKEIRIGVNGRNLITEINISDWKGASTVECKAANPAKSLLSQVPALRAVRALNVAQMHGYALQLTYSDGSVRNYYLKMFDQPQIPDHVIIDGCLFDERVLNSVSIKDNGICFDNGYAVAAHLLFYRSYRQVRAAIMDQKCYGGILGLKYLLPLKEFKSHFAIQHYWGELGECYGPVNALLNQDGQRITDASFYDDCSDRWCGGKVWRVRMEPTALYGFLREDGTWLAPPVYTSADRVEGGCAKVKRMVSGEQKQFLLTPEGREIPFALDIDTDLYSGGLCPFNATMEPVSAPRPQDYWYQDYQDYNELIPGKWGYVDIEGSVIVEPQYVYAFDFNRCDGVHAIVARLVDGKLLWGAIDCSGREVIPCVYASLFTSWGDAFAFRYDEEDLYGVMDLDGKIMAPPQFAFFEAYDAEHRMITVGENEDTLGVYSVDRQKMIIPAEYDCIDYGKNMISCEIQYTIKERYFDYNGNEFDFSEYDRVSEENGLLRTWKNRKYGYMELDGTVVVPNILGGFAFDCLALYQKGYVITSENEREGLATADGREILPPKYAQIVTYDDFLIASERISGNWCIRDTLYAYDGTPILRGPYRGMHYHRDERELTAETPYGIEHFQLISEGTHKHEL